MTSINNKIFVDFSDMEQLRFLMRSYGETETMFPGINELGEKQSISFYPTKIELVTFQDNGFERRNTYYYDSTTEEFYNGLWKSRGVLL